MLEERPSDLAREADWVEMGRLGRPKGLKGWLHVQSWSDPPEALLDYPTWYLRDSSGRRVTAEVAEVQATSKGFVVRLDGLGCREQAESKVGLHIDVPRADLPPLEPGEHYRHDLIGYRVCNMQGVDFGILERFDDLPANAVMIVRGERERWVPVSAQHRLQVDRDAQRIVVDWPEDF